MTTPINTTTTQGPYTYNSGITSTNPFITWYSLRNPNDHDVNYPIQKRWVNFTTAPASEWILEAFSNSTGQLNADWIQLTGPGSGVVIGFNVPLGSSPVFPGSLGFVTYTSTGGSIEITGSTNTINWDLPGGYPAIQRLETDDGLFETPTGTPGTIIIHGTGGITTSQGTPHQVNVNIAGGTFIGKITGDDSVAVVPDSSNNINLFGNTVANATHAKAVYTHSPVAHEEQIDVQVAAAIASTDITKVGLAAFDSNHFSVDSSGFVQITSSPSPGFQSINVQVFTSSGTYTPIANMAYCQVECVGGGGGGGSTGATAGGQCAAGAGGSGGGYCKKVFNAATIGVSQTVTIGAAGSGGTSGGAGSGGGTTTFGALLTSTGGGGGNGCPSGTANIIGSAVAGAGSGGDVNTGGGIGTAGLSYNPFANGGSGGSTYFGGGGNFSTTNGTAVAGVTATSYGGGGGGAAAGASQSATNGGNGAKGVIIVTEYVI